MQILPVIETGDSEADEAAGTVRSELRRLCVNAI